MVGVFAQKTVSRLPFIIFYEIWCIIYHVKNKKPFFTLYSPFIEMKLSIFCSPKESIHVAKEIVRQGRCNHSLKPRPKPGLFLSWSWSRWKGRSLYIRLVAYPILGYRRGGNVGGNRFFNQQKRGLECLLSHCFYLDHRVKLELTIPPLAGLTATLFIAQKSSDTSFLYPAFQTDGCRIILNLCIPDEIPWAFKAFGGFGEVVLGIVVLGNAYL